jgi:hypothetical protein
VRRGRLPSRCRHAEEAVQSAVSKICRAAFDAGTIEGYEQHETDARAIDASGGTVGPLPDGTVIEVKPTTRRALVRESHGTRMRQGPGRWSMVELVDAFNAKQASAC